MQNRDLLIQTQIPYHVIISQNDFLDFVRSLDYPLSTRFVLVSDDKVAPLYLDDLKKALQAAGYSVLEWIMPHGEENKSQETYFALLDFLAKETITRSDVLIALGGGVVGDLTGFVAATYLRGIDFIGIPTTLLSMVDSSVGGKTGINLSRGKNLCGAFKQPRLVYCLVPTLESLEEMYFQEGLAEVVKYAFIGEKWLYALLKEETITKDSPNLVSLIERAIAMKAKIVQEDEFETGKRKLLNFGHTFAHGIEKASGYTYRHGKAVAIGMKLIMEGALQKDLVPKSVVEDLNLILGQQGLDFSWTEGQEKIVYYALSDKKRMGDKITLVLANENGGFLHDVEVANLGEFLPS